MDVYDALKTKRPYKTPMSQEEALKVMASEVEKGWWDGNTFTEFKKLLQKKEPSFPAAALSTEYRVSEPRTDLVSNA